MDFINNKGLIGAEYPRICEITLALANDVVEDGLYCAP